MFEKMEEWALLYVTGFLPKGGPKIAIPPDTLIANQLIQRDTRVGTSFCAHADETIYNVFR